MLKSNLNDLSGKPSKKAKRVAKKARNKKRAASKTKANDAKLTAQEKRKAFALAQTRAKAGSKKRSRSAKPIVSKKTVACRANAAKGTKCSVATTSYKNGTTVMVVVEKSPRKQYNKKKTA